MRKIQYKKILGLKMINIKCAKCKRKIYRYIKIGKGRVLHCWKDRIVEDFSICKDNIILCKCGNQIGVDQQKWIKLNQNSITISGTKH